MHFRTGQATVVPHLLPMLTAFYALHRQWDPARFTTRTGFETGYGRWLSARSADPHSVFLVAVPGEADTAGPAPIAFPIAFLIGTLEEDPPLFQNPIHGFIHDLWVDPLYRNEGVARQLVTLAFERFKELGVTQVRLDTAIANSSAQSLFLTCGFRPSTQTLLAEI